MSEEILTGYSKIIEALTEKGRWQAERIRELEAALAKSAEAQDHFCGRWLWQAMLAQQYKQDSNGHKKSCADALARSLEATEECLRMGAENERLREAFPCNIFDIVFVDTRTLPYNYLHPFDRCKDFARCEVIGFSQTKQGYFMKMAALYPSRINKRGYLRFSVKSVGKTVFFSREEAEQALEGGSD